MDFAEVGSALDSSGGHECLRGRKLLQELGEGLAVDRHAPGLGSFVRVLARAGRYEVELRTDVEDYLVVAKETFFWEFGDLILETGTHNGHAAFPNEENTVELLAGSHNFRIVEVEHAIQSGQDFADEDQVRVVVVNVVIEKEEELLVVVGQKSKH